MKRFKDTARIAPDAAAHWRKVFGRHSVASTALDGVAALTAKGVDAATAQADEVMRLARDHTFH